MLFMLTMRHKNSYFTVPLTERGPLFTKRVAFVEKNINKGKCKQAYFDVDLKGAFFIWELESNEEAAMLMLDMPGREYDDMELCPILEFDHGVKKMGMFFELETKE
jgi:hypothetical protein